MKILNCFQIKMRNFGLFLKKTLELRNNPRIIRATKLLGILVFPFSSFLLFFVKPFLNPQEYHVASFLFALSTCGLLFWCVFSPRALGLLSFLFRYGLKYQVVQQVFLLCVQVELSATAPFLVIKVLWLIFVMVYSCVLCQAIAKS